jgi:hypothetical protein
MENEICNEVSSLLKKILNSQATFAFGQIDDIMLRLEPLKKDANATRFDNFVVLQS